MRRMRIKQWLVLILRTLAIACLVLAFSRPTVQGDWASIFGQRAGTSTVIVIDNSLSMSLRDSHGEQFGQAQELAAGIVEQMSPGDEVFLLATAAESRTLPAAYHNRGPALDAVNQLTVQPGSMDMDRVIRQAGELLGEASNINREIFVISDFQQRTFGAGDIQTVRNDARVLLMPVGDRDFSNAAVTDVRILSRIIEAGQPVRMRATLANYGQEPLDSYLASVFLEGERVAQATTSIEAGSTADVEFVLTPQVTGWLGGHIEIEDDAFEYDNVRHFVLHVPDERNLLLVQGQGQSIDFVQLALSPELTRGRVNFNLNVIPETSLAGASLSSYDAVLLTGVRDFSSGEISALARYVSDGGGLMIFPGEGSIESDYGVLFSALGGGSVAGFSGAPGGDQVTATFDRTDLEHHLFEGIFDEGRRRTEAVLESPDVFFSMNYTPAGGREQTLIRMSNGFPFLQEIQHGSGSALFISVAPNTSWSDFPVRGLFIPLLYRSMYYLSSRDAAQSASIAIGEPAELRIRGTSEGQTIRIYSPDEQEFTPEQRQVFAATILQIPPAHYDTGVYNVRSGDELLRRFAINLSEKESDLARLSPEVAQTMLAAGGDAEVRLIDGRGRNDRQFVAQALHEERYGVELWNVFLMLALIFLLAEMLVAMQWKQEPAVAA